jgi:hypothetical protein
LGTLNDDEKKTWDGCTRARKHGHLRILVPEFITILRIIISTTNPYQKQIENELRYSSSSEKGSSQFPPVSVSLSSPEQNERKGLNTMREREKIGSDIFPSLYL